MRTGILGGTFNPPHLGHLHAARLAREALGLDKVLFIPTNIPPHKALPEDTATVADRCEMVRLLLADTPWARLDTLEVARGGASYTVDTLRELRRFLPAHVELCFLMGADAAARLGEWREASELGGLARFAVVSQRDDVSLDGRDLSRLAQIIDAREILQVAMPQMDVSSTDLREKVRQGRSIRDEVPAVVADYIESHGLYQR